MIAAQGGDPRVTEDTSLLPKAKETLDLLAEEDGWLEAVVTSDVGNAAKLLGAGREKKTDVLDLSVGIVMKKRIGDRVHAGDVLATLHIGDRSDRVGAYDLLRHSLKIGKEPVEKPVLIHAVVEE